MHSKNTSFIDRLIIQGEQMLRTLSGVNQGTNRPSPANEEEAIKLNDNEARHVVGLMRVNHAGEIMAQALYYGQMFAAEQDSTLKQHLHQAALEETDHLIWCRQRIEELGGRTSVFDPLWYAGALTMGGLAGIAGKSWSLGFVAAVEQQVHDHLQSHIEALPEQDKKTKAVLKVMQSDEDEHKNKALEAGGKELPQAVKGLMKANAKIMTTLSYYL